ncbi:hypothetical protein WKI65_12840 [Streptomyces sp. MS1.AVA.3]|uniref:hypothetical protein n=1 Tax=Streptomyces decoyicus TaxID=249567 RepID=UPI0030BFAD6E
MGNEAAQKQIKMSEQQAVDRAEEIIHQAVGGMSPKPTLKPAGNSTGPCIALDDHRSDDRVQVMRSYQLTGVPGNEAKKLVRQARDAWVKHGYRFTSSEADGDWSDPFPSVNMRTEPDNFSVEALTGVMDRKKGEGLAAITVTSPCFLPKASEKPPATPSALHPVHNDERAERRVLAHSSRIYDALRAPYAPEQDSRARTVNDSDGTWLHHAWSTAPLASDEIPQVMARAQKHFARTGWTLRSLVTRAGAPALVAFSTQDQTVAQITPSPSGSIRVAVTGPAVPVLRADV